MMVDSDYHPELVPSVRGYLPRLRSRLRKNRGGRRRDVRMRGNMSGMCKQLRSYVSALNTSF